MNSYNTDIYFFSNYYNLQSDPFELSTQEFLQFSSKMTSRCDWFTVISVPFVIGERLETLRYPEIGVRVTGSAMFFSFCDDVIDLTR